MEGITEPLYDLLHLIKFKRQKKKKNRKFATNRKIEGNQKEILIKK